MKLIKKLRVKLARRVKRLNSLPDISKSPNYKTATSIFRFALRDDSADLLLRPVNNSRIIKLEDKGMSIVLEKNYLQIINHTFSYQLDIPYEMWEKLSKLFDIKLDSIVSKEEQAIVSQVTTGLTKVLETFKQ